MAGKNCENTSQSSKAKGAKPKANKPKAKASSSNGNNAGAVVNTAVKVKGKQTQGLREQGTDVLELVKIDSKKIGVVLQQVVTPQAFPRLGQLAKSFQRIRYHRLRFEIITGCPTTASGVYVAGFVKDARDPVKDSTASATLLASGGEVVKMWQSTEVVVGRLPDLYYTSANTAEQRWSSPGSLVISLISPPDTKVTIQVFVHWDVALSQPTYESGESSPDSDGFVTVKLDAYASNDNPYLSVRSGNSWRPMTPDDFTPALEDKQILTVLSMRYAATENSSGNLDGIFGFRKIGVKDRFLYPIDDRNNKSDQNFHGQTYILFAGEKCSVENPPNFQRARWYRSALMTSPSSVMPSAGVFGSECLPASPSQSSQESQSTSSNSSTKLSSAATSEETLSASSAFVRDILRELRRISPQLQSMETTSSSSERLMEAQERSEDSLSVSFSADNGFELV